MEESGNPVSQAAIGRLGLDGPVHDHTVNQLLKLAARTLGFDHAGLLVSVDGREQFIAHTAGAWPSAPGVSALCSLSVVRGEPLLIRDLGASSEFNYHPSVVGGPQFRALASIPLYFGMPTPVCSLSLLRDTPLDADPSSLKPTVELVAGLIEDALLRRDNAVRDGVTGRYNRRFFRDHVGAEWRRSLKSQLPLTLMAVGLQPPKGQLPPAGDSGLRLVADVLQSSVRPNRDLVCHFEDQRFVVVLPGTVINDAVNLAHGICDAVERVGWSDGKTEAITVSIGLSGTEHEDQLRAEYASDLMQRAFSALFHALDDGPGGVRVEFNPLLRAGDG
ncbi:sensor domain-containing diguanylate cyclase [uncultured Abyssibacter sp.]|uniref:sensor domain-containing diguanylate cyclase n=1 Tax=uncultured Abyssibacter sp. TaxID=2320202 RepID=UPI0032B19E3B